MNDQLPPPNPVNLLKELLFEGEARRLDELSKRLEQEIGASSQRDQTISDRLEVVFDRAGTDERLLHSVAAVIDGALREAEVSRHEQVSRAIAPLVVRTIKTQLRESQDEMVDALYPITGRMVKTYVQAEINRLMVEINAKLGGARPVADDQRGLSQADLALAAANNLKVEEIFLVRRGSGDLIAHWERPDPAAGSKAPQTQGSNRDVLLSGYLSGIMSLSEEAFGASPGSFRTLSFSGGDRIFVRGAAAHLLAVRCSGSAPATVENVIDEVFLDTLERYQKLLAAENAAEQNSRPKIQAFLPTVAGDIETRTDERRASLTQQPAAAKTPLKPSFGRLYALAALIIAPFLAWGAWSAYQTFETVRVESTANRILEAIDEVAGMPPKIDVERGGRALTVSGFVPTAELRDRIINRLGQDLPEATLRNRLGVLPKDASQFEAALARWRSDSERRFQDMAAGAIGRSVMRVHNRLTAIRDLSLQLVDRAGRTADTQKLRGALTTALDQSRISTSAPPDHRQLVALWQALAESNGFLASLSPTQTTSARPAQTPPADDGQLAEDCTALTDRIEASVISLLAAKIEGLQPSARQEAESFIRKSVVFFANNSDFRDSAAANTVLDQIARRLRDNPDLNLRVVGYTDERGTQTLNNNLAQLRADRVASLLAERGIAAARVIAVGRTVGKEVTRNVGPTSSNRRVEFEISFAGEMDASP